MSMNEAKISRMAALLVEEFNSVMIVAYHGFEAVTLRVQTDD